MKLKLALLLLACLVAGLGCSPGGTGPSTSNSGTPGMGKIDPISVPTNTPK